MKMYGKSLKFLQEYSFTMMDNKIETIFLSSLGSRINPDKDIRVLRELRNRGLVSREDWDIIDQARRFNER